MFSKSMSATSVSSKVSQPDQCNRCEDVDPILATAVSECLDCHQLLCDAQHTGKSPPPPRGVRSVLAANSSSVMFSSFTRTIH
jgi:hypothetical protein